MVQAMILLSLLNNSNQLLLLQTSIFYYSMEEKPLFLCFVDVVVVVWARYSKADMLNKTNSKQHVFCRTISFYYNNHINTKELDY